MGGGKPSAKYITAAVVTFVGVLLASVLKGPKPGRPIQNARYAIDLEALETARAVYPSIKPGVLRETFVQSKPDNALSLFLNESASASASTVGILQTHAKEILYWWLQFFLGWSRTDASGYLNRASLYVASRSQLAAHVGTQAQLKQAKSLLDIGSGTGTETVKLQKVLRLEPKDVTCIENSVTMQTKLRSYGFRIAASPAELPASKRFSHVSLLNVLDRCDFPSKILSTAVQKLEKDGVLLLGVVLPFNAKVYQGKRFIKLGHPAWRAPFDPLHLAPIPTRAKTIGTPFQIDLVRVIENVLSHHPNLRLRSWTKLPYVSSGDVRRTHYTIDMALMVFSLDASGDL